MEWPRRLVLVRHAESVTNALKNGSTFYANDEVRKRTEGRPDHKNPITQRGWEQARQTGRALRAEFGVFDAIYHSGYTRTTETLEGLLEAYTSEERGQMPVMPSLFLRERDAGYGYYMTEAEAAAAFPYLQAYWQATGSFFARPPGGKSMADMVEQVDHFFR